MTTSKLPPQLHEYVLANLRTWSALVAGAVITWLTARGVQVDVELTSLVGTVLFGVVSGVYYLAVSALERWVDRRFGWLLLAARKPSYKR